jgi:glucose/arabinose dehydrogenase
MLEGFPLRRRVVAFARRLSAVAIAGTLLAGAAPAVPAQAALEAGQLQLVRVTGGFLKPLAVTHAGDGSGRLFVVQRDGVVRVVKSGKLQAAPFLDIDAKVSSTGTEDGLLGLAFHPDFEANRRLFVLYTNAASDLVLARFTATADGSSASAATEEIVLSVGHPGSTVHHGGTVAFGPDGTLYVSLGDGGGADGFQNAPDLESLLGKILRIDVDGIGEGPNGLYAIPSDNPFVGGEGRGEVWAFGLRNPYKLSIDRATGDRWIADVGASTREEIDREVASDPGGHDYGWPTMEGSICRPPTTGCDTSGLTLPVAEYGHDLGCSITGGHVYRGPSQRDLQGQYVFADFCSGRVWTMPAGGSTITQRLNTDRVIAGFGESEAGELFAVDYGSGELYRVVAPEFTDIASNSFLDDIHWLAYEGITSGCGSGRFCPTDPVTRGQMASFLARAFDLPTATTDSFTDDDGTTHEANIDRVALAGITKGCSPTTFCPLANVTRGQMASFLVRALGLPTTTTDYFTDDETSTHEADINRVAAAGITTGCSPTTFCPSATVTRGQMAAFLRRALDD